MRPRIIVAAMALAAGTQVAAAETLRLSPGESTRFELVENPSTGYSWSIDQKASVGLDRLQISEGGYKAGADMPGSPGKHSWIIRAVAPGKAVVAFANRRPWESAVVETRQVTILVGPR
jgi:predicted secreted protein